MFQMWRRRDCWGTAAPRQCPVNKHHSCRTTPTRIRICAQASSDSRVCTTCETNCLERHIDFLQPWSKFVGRGKELSEQQTNTLHRNHNTGAKKKREKGKRIRRRLKCRKCRLKRLVTNLQAHLLEQKALFSAVSPGLLGWLVRV